MKLKSTLLALAAMTAAASAATISVNFVATGGTGSSKNLGAADAAGVVVATNWNNISSGINTGVNATTSNLNGDNSGTLFATTTSITYIQNFWSVNEGSTNDGKVNSGYTNTSATVGTTVSIAGLGAEFTTPGYNVIVYLGGTDQQGVLSAIEVGANIGGGTNQWIRTVRPTENTFLGLSSTTFATEPLAQASTTDSNYIMFTGQTGSSFDLNVLKDPSSTATWSRAGIRGIQIVAIPEPSAALLGGLGLLGLLRRRRA